MEHTLPYQGIECVRSLPAGDPGENRSRVIQSLQGELEENSSIQECFLNQHPPPPPSTSQPRVLRSTNTPAPPPPFLNPNLLMISLRWALSGSRLLCAASGCDTCRHTLQTGLLYCGLEQHRHGAAECASTRRRGGVGGCRGGEWSEWAGAGEATVPVSIQSVSNEGSQSLLLPPPSHRPPPRPPTGAKTSGARSCKFIRLRSLARSGLFTRSSHRLTNFS